MIGLDPTLAALASLSVFMLPDFSDVVGAVVPVIPKVMSSGDVETVRLKASFIALVTVKSAATPVCKLLVSSMVDRY